MSGTFILEEVDARTEVSSSDKIRAVVRMSEIGCTNVSPIPNSCMILPKKLTSLFSKIAVALLCSWVDSALLKEKFLSSLMTLEECWVEFFWLCCRCPNAAAAASMGDIMIIR